MSILRKRLYFEENNFKFYGIRIGAGLQNAGLQ